MGTMDQKLGLRIRKRYKKMTQQNIIAPIDREILKSELNANRFLRYTRKGGND